MLQAPSPTLTQTFGQKMSQVGTVVIFIFIFFFFEEEEEEKEEKEKLALFMKRIINFQQMIRRNHLDKPPLSNKLASML